MVQSLEPSPMGEMQREVGRKLKRAIAKFSDPLTRACCLDTGGLPEDSEIQDAGEFLGVVSVYGGANVSKKVGIEVERHNSR